MRKTVKLLMVFMIAVSLAAGHAMAGDTATGKVFWDKNKNGILDRGERGIAKVCVSNGREVVQTNRKGEYSLPAYDDMVVFVIKPSGWMTPVDGNNLPQFSYMHKPAGSPDEIQTFCGLESTGKLPESINFPLYKSRRSKRFNAIVTGDTQVYNDREINYLRDSLVKSVKGTDALFCISMGDNVGDDLSLYPRYLEVMGEMGIPVYYVPGNHDLDFDATSDDDSFDTYKSYIGATYFSFNYGDVHFVILDSVEYPSASNNGSYNGMISDIQMEWLKNDLSFVPKNHLVVLNMHIPIVSDVDSTSAVHQVDNREALYALLDGRKALSLAGHTHTLSHFVPGDELDGWGQPTPIYQTIVGAACGSWWSGDFNEAGTPVSYMRCGAPKGYLEYAFNGRNYLETFKADRQPVTKQINLSFLTDTFLDWFNLVTGDPTQTTINDIEFKDILTESDLNSGLLVANVWNASQHARVICQFDDMEPIEMQWTMDTKDPHALMNQVYVLRGVPGFRLWDAQGGGTEYGPGEAVSMDSWLWTDEGKSTHLWTCALPDLASGIHAVTVQTTDIYGQVYVEKKVFEVE